jgi:hypothetical protein
MVYGKCGVVSIPTVVTNEFLFDLVLLKL